MLLVKPQFELGPERVSKGGVVRDDEARAEAVDSVSAAAARLGLVERSRADSVLPGPKGNREIFLWLELVEREEFDYRLLGEGQVDGEDCYVIRRAGKTRAIQRKYGYSRDENFIRKSDYVPVKIVFYDLAGDLLKELSVMDVAVIGPYRYPSHVVMENRQTGHASEIMFEDIESPEDISDEYFTHRYLQNY